MCDNVIYSSVSDRAMTGITDGLYHDNSNFYPNRAKFLNETHKLQKGSEQGPDFKETDASNISAKNEDPMTEVITEEQIEMTSGDNVKCPPCKECKPCKPCDPCPAPSCSTYASVEPFYPLSSNSWLNWIIILILVLLVANICLQCVNLFKKN